MVLTFYRFIYEWLFVCEFNGSWWRWSKWDHNQTNTPLKTRVNDILCWLWKGETFKGQSFQYAVTTLYCYTVILWSVYLYYHVNSILSALPVIVLACLCLVSIEIVNKTLCVRVKDLHTIFFYFATIDDQFYNGYMNFNNFSTPLM